MNMDTTTFDHKVSNLFDQNPLTEIKEKYEPETIGTTNTDDQTIKRQDELLKCGEIFWKSDNFQLNCSQCNTESKHFTKISLFLRHFLRIHLENENYSIEKFLADDPATSSPKSLNNDDIKLEKELNSLNDFFITGGDSNNTFINDYSEGENNSLNEEPIIESSSHSDQEEEEEEDALTKDEVMKETTNNLSRSKRALKNKKKIMKNSLLHSEKKKKIKTKRKIRCKNVDQKKSQRNLTGQKTNKIVLPGRPEKLTCEICGKVKHKYQMRQHLRSHDDSRYVHKCQDCDKLFISQKSLDLHRKSFHIADGRQFLCPFDNCNKKFVSEHLLKEHRRSHTSFTERPFKCELCPNKGFLYERKLKEHIRIYHINGKTLKCDKCDRRYYFAYDLKRHKVIHEEVKPFSCDECPSRFVSVHTLARHKKCHSNVKEFSCDICGKQFAIYDGIYSHMKTHGINYSKDQKKNNALRMLPTEIPVNE